MAIVDQMTKTFQVVLQKNQVFNLWLRHQRSNIGDQFFCSLPKNPGRDQNVLGSDLKKKVGSIAIVDRNN
jgi:hypothetical protein